jgi:hypothetical protein
MTLEIAHDPDDTQLAEFLMPAARDAVSKYMPGEMASVILPCIERAPDSVLAYGFNEIKDAGAAEAIAKRFSGDLRAAQLSMVQLMRNAPRAPALSVYIQAVKQEEDAWTARYGLQGIQKLGAEAELDAETQAAVSRWRVDPFFALLALQQRDAKEPSPVPGDLRDIASRVEAGGARALRIHYMLFQIAEGLANSPGTVKQLADEFASVRNEMWNGLTQDAAALGCKELSNVPAPPMKELSKSQ